jgi:hypothetical protein
MRINITIPKKNSKSCFGVIIVVPYYKNKVVDKEKEDI